MDIDLSENVCRDLHTRSPDDSDFFDQTFTLQVIGIKEVPQAGKNGQKRHRVILSDSSSYVQAMMTNQLNGEADKCLTRYAIVKVKLACSYVQDKRLLVVADIEYMATADERIGNPVKLDAETPAPNKPASHATPASTSKAPAPAPARKPAGKPADGARAVTFIEGLSPYGNSWTIKARVMQKGDIKKWSNARGEGKLCNMTLMDQSGEIRATCFNAAVDKFFDMIEEGKVYYVSKARVNLAKKLYNNVNNDYELTFENNTEVEECLDDSDAPQLKYNFVNISELEGVAKDSLCDVIAVVQESGPLGEITSKQFNKTNKKRELTLVDDSKNSVRLTLWGRHAESWREDEKNPIVAFKGVKVGDFGGRSLSFMSSSIMTIDPDIEEAHRIRGWFDQEGESASIVPQSNKASGAGGGSGFNRKEFKTIAQAKALEVGDRDMFFSSRATVMHIRPERIAYDSCPTEGCNKKVEMDGDKWRCEKCNKTYDDKSARYALTLAVADVSGQAWYSGFHETGLTVFDGQDAKTLLEQKEAGDPNFTVTLHRALGKTFNFVIRAKQDSFNDTVRVKHGVLRIAKPDYVEESKVLLEQIESSWGMV
ncbi:replication factor-A protein 1 [Cylindrobasidium torrendii FP15055 ss-10]|uniref:Replication protein A subunit n=1 Tax=Cylindrobasidium torrendii FP15055 ss-10 TaxID=1314674 RepID=A0A0D7B4Q7_9AGAR|nr:replication factor-A protein 1 [Cylindrobasidium torrendii FP15055 ss-10]